MHATLEQLKVLEAMHANARKLSILFDCQKLQAGQKKPWALEAENSVLQPKR